ncbi:MAG: hypothetical protein LAN62_17195 [Acidobacteriia bacterium]|nr:hypothetical protein [Terriglobia bacterium]
MPVRRHIWTTIGSCLATAFLLWPLPAPAANPTRLPPLPLDGKLLELPGTGPVLRVKDKDFPLIARTTWLLHTLQDKRLVNHEIRVEGEWQPDGTLKVNHFYTIHDGKLFRVRYFCETCNIEALEPGNCICCQEPTEMQEIPVAPK